VQPTDHRVRSVFVHSARRPQGGTSVEMQSIVKGW
jgi:hypothetical protein